MHLKARWIVLVDVGSYKGTPCSYFSFYPLRILKRTVKKMSRSNKPELVDDRRSRKIRKEFRKNPRLYGLRNKLLLPNALETDEENHFKVLYECHDGCECKGYRCENVLVGDGMRVKLEIFLTENKGWGVRARKWVTSFYLRQISFSLRT